MKFIIAAVFLLCGSAAHADAGYLKCVFSRGTNEVIMEGEFDDKAWNIKKINEDDLGYEGIKAKVAGGQISFYLDTAGQTGGDPDFTEIYDVKILGPLKKGLAVNATLNGSHVSHDETSYFLNGMCQVN